MRSSVAGPVVVRLVWLPACKLLEAFGKERVAIAVHDVDINIVAVVQGRENVVVVKVSFAVVDEVFVGMVARTKHDLPDAVGASVYFSTFKEA
jgi:hypothetical protein